MFFNGKRLNVLKFINLAEEHGGGTVADRDLKKKEKKELMVDGKK